MSKKILLGHSSTRGIDVSSYQHDINWVQVKASGHEFAFIKASDGATSHDRYFASHSKGARAAGVLIGPYHFFHFLKDPIEQMDSFIAAMGPREKGDLPPVIDVEWTDAYTTVTGKGSEVALKALEYLEKKLGVTPIIYTSAAFFTDAHNPAAFKRFPLWIASYRTDHAIIPDAWDTFTFWQQTDHEAVEGAGKIDGDVFNGSLADLRAFAGLAAPVAAPVPAPIAEPIAAPAQEPVAQPAPAAPVAPAQGFFARLISKIKSFF